MLHVVTFFITVCNGETSIKKKIQKKTLTIGPKMRKKLNEKYTLMRFFLKTATKYMIRDKSDTWDENDSTTNIYFKTLKQDEKEKKYCIFYNKIKSKPYRSQKLNSPEINSLKASSSSPLALELACFSLSSFSIFTWIVMDSSF